MQNTGGLHPEYRSYERQKCFVGHSREAEWRDDILSACAEVLPKFGLEPWYAADHFDPTKPLRDKVVELIANARYGIYDLSSWQDKSGGWHVPRNVFIELGMAIVLNRPALLLRHASNQAVPLPSCLQGVELLEFVGDATLKEALEKQLPKWLHIPPERNWLNRFCILGDRVCSYRETHPRVRQWGHKTLHCHASDGLDEDHPDFQITVRKETRAAFEDIFRRYSDLEFSYLDELPLVDGYQFILCSLCHMVRSTPFAVYQLLPHTPAEVFIALGMSIALETLFEYGIPKVLLVRQDPDLPSLLRGYEVVEASSSSEVKKKLKTSIPAVMQKVRETIWKPRPLPFVEFVVWPGPGMSEEATPSEPTAELREASKASILFTDNDPGFLATRKEFLETAGYKVITAKNPTEARRILERERIDLAIVDLRLIDDSDEADRSGLDLAKEEAFRDVPKIITSGFPTVDDLQEALRPVVDGLPPAQDFVAKQDGPDAMLQAVSRLAAQIEQMDSLRGSLLRLLVDFESAIRELVARVLQARYGQEWPERLGVAREPNRLTLGVLLRLVREQGDVFEPLFTTPQAYSTLVTSAREITTTRNAIAHGVPGPDAAEMQRVQELVEESLPVVRSAADRAAPTGRWRRLFLEVYEEWRQSGRFLIPRDEFIPLSEYAETATLSQEESLFMLQAALYFGINVIEWVRRNRNNPLAVEVVIDTVRGPHWRSRWRAALALLEMDPGLVQRGIEDALGGSDLDEDAALALRSVERGAVAEHLRTVAQGALGDITAGKARDILWQMGIDIETDGPDDEQKAEAGESPDELLLLRIFGQTAQRQAVRPLDKGKRDELRQQMQDFFVQLPAREREVLELRFGLRDGKQSTLREIGQEFGVTGERIRQIEASALSRLRHPTIARQLRNYMDYLIPRDEIGGLQSSAHLGSQTLVATFGLTIEEVRASEELPPDVPTDYAHLCDWLEGDLQRRLQDSIGDFHYPEPSKRDGETLSVRIAFQWRQEDEEPDFGDLGWWSLLKLAPFEEAYPGQDAARFWAQAGKE